jgi:hypothetical protein
MTLKGDVHASQLRLTAGVRRLAVLLLALAMAAVALAAVGLAADTDPRKRLTAADKAKAASMILRPSDFPAGWRRSALTPSDTSDLSCPGYSPKQSDLVLTGEAMAEFTGPQGLPSISSVANVYRTRREAGLAWARSVTPALVPCAARTFEQETEKRGGVQVTVTRKGAFAFPSYSPRSVAYRIGLTMSAPQGGATQTVPFTIHMIALGHGRGDVLLMTVGVGSGVPIADLRVLAKRTAQRLAASRL